jgi:hypothetical protein
MRALNQPEKTCVRVIKLTSCYPYLLGGIVRCVLSREIVAASLAMGSHSLVLCRVHPSGGHYGISCPIRSFFRLGLRNRRAVRRSLLQPAPTPALSCKNAATTPIWSRSTKHWRGQPGRHPRRALGRNCHLNSRVPNVPTGATCENRCACGIACVTRSRGGTSQ